MQTNDGHLARFVAPHNSTIPAWAPGLSFSLPQALRDLLASGAGRNEIQPRAAAAAAQLREMAMYTSAMPASSRLPFSYRTIPGPVRRVVANAIGRLQRHRQDHWARYPGWPLDLSADFAADLGDLPRALPSGRTPVILTHDLDSAEGLENLVERFLPIEERAGARSANFVVPCNWPLDYALLDKTHGRGHEIGIHGYDHSNRTPFLAPIDRRTRLDAAKPLIARYGIAGYRAPSLVRTEALLTDLGGLYRYDSSVPTSGGLFPVPNNGCASARPFRLHGLWEIPLSMPRDGSMQFLGHTPAQILAIWRECMLTIARSGGVVVLLTHCEESFSGNEPMLQSYDALLNEISSDPHFEFVTFSKMLTRLDATSN